MTLPFMVFNMSAWNIEVKKITKWRKLYFSNQTKGVPYRHRIKKKLYHIAPQQNNKFKL